MNPEKDINEKNKEISTIISENNVSIRDRDIFFIYKKIEKIVAALYLVTTVLEDKEPVKWDIRQKSLELLSFNLHLKDSFISERNRMLPILRDLCDTILSYLSICYVSGLISEMNFSILKKEISFSSTFISENLNKEKRLLASDFFSVDVPKDIEKRVQTDVKDSPQYKGHNFESKKDSTESGFSHRHNWTLNEKSSQGYSSFTSKKSDRKKSIIEIVRVKNAVNIKDVSSMVKGCSEKTIQRELLALVKSGVLKKEGERRWSVYSLR